MKKRMLCFLVFVLLSVILAGCGNSVKNEKELMDDFLVHADNYLVEGSSISEFSIIKRLTETDNKKDTVYVQLIAEHPAATAYQAFIMHYTLYNDGWKLDNVESYQGHDAIYKTVPKNDPTKEEIMEQLTAYSNAAIDEYNRTWQTNDPYFFEEGKYAVQICDGDRPNDQTYECIVIAERTYNYLVLEEMQKLYFVFDLLRYEWVLYNVEIFDNSGSWYIDGYWREPDSGATILFEHNYAVIANGKQTDRFEGSCIPRANNTDFILQLYLPSSLGGSGGGLSDYIGGAFEYIYCAISVHPDELLADKVPLVPIQLEESVPALETGIFSDVSIEDEAVEYYEMAEIFMNAIFVERDLTRVESVLHPLVSGEYMEVMNQLVQSDGLQLNTMLYEHTVLFSTNDADWDYVPVATKQAFPNATEFANCYFSLVLTDNGNTECVDILISFVKENDRIYVCGF